MANDNTALVLGARGGVGGEIARQLRDAGWQVRALQRGLASDEMQREGITWLRGDAMVAQDVARAAAGCSVIVHAVNPPGYRDWDKLVLPMLDNTLAAARTAHATVMLPGTLYNYGPDAFPLIADDAPQQPLTRKGAIRVEMEKRMEAAVTAGDCRVLIVRAGDFFGPRTGNSWFAQGLVKPGQAIRKITRPGVPGVGHQWAYLPDLGRTVLALLNRRQTLPDFARFNFGGHWDADGEQMLASIRDCVAANTGQVPRIVGFPWWLTALAAPFVPTLKELREVRYLWQQPVQLDNSGLLATLGAEPHTPWDEAVEATLRGLGCLSVAAMRTTAPAL
ncbi:MAG TPA: NAD-dependent epimerase/dehydratase family protein [Rhodocyclaceae bacterium]|nr:NAD-dependent epimerase/dehydratase family protein [Rhodocyclaceae bacterium]